MNLGDKIRDWFEKNIVDRFKSAGAQIIHFILELEVDVSMKHLKESDTVWGLDLTYKTLPPWTKDREDVISVYQQRKQELEKAGLRTIEDLAISWIARQLASSVWYVTNTALPKIEEWLDKFSDHYHIRKEELEALKEMARTGEFGLLGVVMALSGALILPFVYAGLAPVTRKVEQESEKKIRSGLLSPTSGITATWRELMTNEELDELLAKYGYTNEDIERIKKMEKFYPTVSDFITFMVRETFKEEIVKKYAYDEGYPEEIEPYTSKAGVDKEWVKHYWRAHWVLPSPTMGYEMLHRGIIDIKDLETLLKMADYLPYYVPKMIEIAYSPYTRVDIRRMYDEGVMKKDEVKRAYMDIGYDDARAEKLTQWTITDKLKTERDLTKSEILKLFEIEEIDFSTAKGFLISIGYSEDEADFILAIHTAKMKEDEINDKIDLITLMYEKGDIDYDTMIIKLDELNIPSFRRDKIVLKAIRAREKSIKRPTKEDILKWFYAGQITTEKAKELLSFINIPAQFIPLYMGERIS